MNSAAELLELLGATRVDEPEGKSMKWTYLCIQHWAGTRGESNICISDL